MHIFIYFCPKNPNRVSRLQNVTPVSYSEVPPKKDEFKKNGRVVIEQGAKPEVYSEEHEKLLGNTDKPWTLFVDGVGKDGKRIYDSVLGKTCHQCRLPSLSLTLLCEIKIITPSNTLFIISSHFFLKKSLYH